MTPTTPKLIHTVAELRETIASLRRQGKSIGLVPTMGALHEGHLSLVRRSRADCDMTVVTIFVNPSQFGPSEDFDKYPRTLDTDMAALASCGVEIVFAPAAEEVYRPKHATWVEVGGVAQPLEGKCRPGHFRGVATVVLKLLNMVGADVAYFGQKDYQQAAVLYRMVEDLNVPIRIEICPTVREPDGLAMSSRNAYLDPTAREHALTLSRGLRRAEELFAGGERDAAVIEAEIRTLLDDANGAEIQYIALADAETLLPVQQIDRPTVIALAVKIGGVRLIDNTVLRP